MVFFITNTENNFYSGLTFFCVETVILQFFHDYFNEYKVKEQHLFKI